MNAGRLAEAIRVHSEFGALLAAPPSRGPRRVGRATTVLLHSQVPWHSVWQRPQELALGLARHRPVIYFAPVQVHEALTRLGGRWKPVEYLEDGRLVVLSPPIFSGEYKVQFARRLNERMSIRMLRSVLGGRRFIYFANAVFSSTIARELGAERVVVDLIDDFSAFDWAPPGSRAAERRLLRRADMVFSGTGTLQRRFAGVRPDIEYLPSGTDPARFQSPAPEPADLKPLPRPRVLFIGTLNDRMDPRLFPESARVAAEFGGSVVLVGPVHGSFQLPGPKPPNMHLLGLKPHGEIPAYYQHCDVGIMPFSDSPAARAINPVKALEYLAVGLPVLSTPIPDVVAEFSSVINIVSPEDWSPGLRALLASPVTEEARRARQAHVQARTWSVLVNSVEERLRRLERRHA